MPTRIPASERTSQKLDELLSRGVADGDARAELLKPAVRKIVSTAGRNDYRFSSIILGVVNSAPFQMRRAEPAATAKK